jgi:D-alanyl-D-alanine carboxypeptidase
LRRPDQPSPFFNASELEPRAPDTAIVAKAQAFGDLGEPCRLICDAAGVIEQVRIGGKRLITQSALEAEVRSRYQPVMLRDG